MLIDKKISNPQIISSILKSVLSFLPERRNLNQRDLCFVNQGVGSRLSAKCIKTNSNFVVYDRYDITLVGGGAYILHLENIKDFFERNINESNEQSNAILESIHDSISNVTTQDIDLVWWPKVSKDNLLFISKIIPSKLIRDDSQLFKTELYKFCTYIQEDLQVWAEQNKDKFKKYFMPDESQYNEKKNDIFSIVVSLGDNLQLGVYYITINLKIHKKIYKLLEFIIHDGASSQNSDTLLPMEMDIMYSNKSNDIIKNIKVPTIEKFLDQQIYAYFNLIKMGERMKQKVEVVYNRLKNINKLIDDVVKNIDLNKMIIDPVINKVSNDFYFYETLLHVNAKLNDFFIGIEDHKKPQIVSSQSIIGGRRYIKTQRKGHQLFNDNPRGRPRTRGIGYGTAKRARNSITRLKGKSKTYKRQVATTMYYRAKHHKYQNKGMRNAMKIWKKYMNHLEK